ncbi:MAG: 5-formyltetrahydrofolate cyclo-ligase [Cyanobacteria bacterium SIG31]|nr:5-formyltetrahydrofolate cyclo-ligase [Cyanobacteria bacterium SIG31]
MNPQKKQLRSWAKEIRKNLDMQTISKELVLKLRNSEEYILAKNIMLFYPKQGEVDLLEILEDKSKSFYLPKINGENLLCCSYKRGDELCESCFKTKEPLTDSISDKILDLVIVPALAVDRNGYRLGYGGGYYDRFLQNISAMTLVCIPENLIVDTIYPDEHDVCIKKIITI